MKVKSESEVAQSCLTLSDPRDCSLPGSSIHGIFQARVLEWVAIAFSTTCIKTQKHYPCKQSFLLASVQFSCSVVSDSLQPHESQHARPPCPSPTPGVHSRLTSIESVMPSSHLILCRPLLLLPLIPPNIRVFSNESTLRMRWPKYWSFQL